MLENERQTIDADYPASGEGRRHQRQRRPIIPVLVGGDQHGMVDDEKIGVRSRQAISLIVMTRRGPRQLQESVRRAVASAERLQFPAHLSERRVMLVTGIITDNMKDRVVGAEAGQGVDMGVGVVTGEISLFQPEKSVDAKLLAENRFQVVTRKMRVTIGVEEALGRGKYRPSSVTLDTSPFKDESHRCKSRRAEGAGLMEQSGNPVIVTCRKLEAPSVETEIEEQRSTGVLHGYRAEIPRPGVVGRQLMDANAAPVGARRSETSLHPFRVGTDHQRYLLPADLPDDFGKDRFHQIQAGGPVAPGVGPCQQHTVLLFPLGGEPPHRSVSHRTTLRVIGRIHPRHAVPAAHCIRILYMIK